MSRVKSVLLSILLVLVLFLNTACPIITGTGTDPDGLEFVYRWDPWTGFYLKMYLDSPLNAPDSMDIVFGQGFAFNQFGNGNLVGAFGIDGNFDGINEYFFWILALSATRAFVDFNNDGQFNEADEPLLEYFGSERRLAFLNPYGQQVLAAGIYSLSLFPFVAALAASELRNGLLETQVTLRRAQAAWTYTLLFAYHAAIMAHLPVGRAAPLSIIPRIQLTNPHGGLVPYSMHFYDQAGLPRTLSTGSGSGSHVTRELAAKTAASILLSGNSPLSLGWGIVYGFLPPVVSVFYPLYENRNELDLPGPSPSQAGNLSLLSAAGLTTGELSTCFTVEVAKNADRDTALAIVNPTSQPATIRLTLKEDDQIMKQHEFELGSMHQDSRFFWQIADLDPATDLPDDFGGTMILQSNTTLALITLTTDSQGRPRASQEAATAADR